MTHAREHVGVLAAETYGGPGFTLPPGAREDRTGIEGRDGLPRNDPASAPARNRARAPPPGDGRGTRKRPGPSPEDEDEGEGEGEDQRRGRGRPRLNDKGGETAVEVRSPSCAIVSRTRNPS